MPSLSVQKAEKLIAHHHLTIAFAESATAGRLAHEFSLTENSGDILIGGVVCYNACVKKSLLGIQARLIEEFTPESAEVTEAMAVQLKSLIGADILVAVTGLTTPGGSESAEKPVGTIFIHIICTDISSKARRVFEGTAEQIVLQAIDFAAENIVAALENDASNPLLRKFARIR